jgi:hypothetical protein
MGVFVACYVACAVWNQRVIPQIANDPLTYHLPAAVQWLQQGRLTPYETWYYNPANTYSPLAGSTFIAWWLAPLGNDVLARFAQAPALLLLFVAMVQIIRALGISTTLAALIATGAVTSRPFISQTILAKDDLFVAAFFAAAVAGLTRVKLSDRLGPWRIGVAVGLLLATKYTALVSIPILLLAIDAPRRVGWKRREWFIAIACALVLAGPWYLRNAMLSGNPLYPLDLPLLHGMFGTGVSPELRTLRGIVSTLVTGYYSTTWLVAITLVILWLWATIVSARRLWRNPLPRLCILGPLIGIGLFVWLSPYPEVRFAYPSLILLFACGGIVAQSVRQLNAMLVVGAILLLLGVITGFVPQLLIRLLPWALGFAAAAVMLAWLASRLRPENRAGVLTIGAIVLVAAIGCLVYMYFSAFIVNPHNGYRASIAPTWREVYGPIADAWHHVRERTPSGATIAYTNTYYTYPLYGFDLSRRVVYVPTRPGVRRLYDLLPARRRLTGDEIVEYVSSELAKNADRNTWLANLAERDADLLFIAKPGHGVLESVPELGFARQDSQRFAPVFENAAAVLFEVRPLATPPATQPATQPATGPTTPPRG